MLVITTDSEEGAALPDLGYSKDRRALARLVLPVTRWLRARHAEKYMDEKERHLDIGCGDGYFLRRSGCRERYGLDALLGDEVTDSLDFPDEHFDYVTMLAVIEHVAEPRPLLEEISRVLRPGGRLVMTTPKEAADKFISLYKKDTDEVHETYFDRDTLAGILPDELEIVAYETFLFGLNQVFCVEKRI